MPEPVAPITRPCGPMPCWADSLMSQVHDRPRLAEPDRDAGDGRGRDAGARPRRGSKECTSPSANGSMKSAGPRSRRCRARPPCRRWCAAASGAGRTPRRSPASTGRRWPAPAPRAAAARAPAPGRRSARPELDPQPGGVLELVPPLGEVEQGDAVQAVGVPTWLPGGSSHHRSPAAGGGGGQLVGAEPGPFAQVRRQQRGEVGERGGHHPHRPPPRRTAGRSGRAAATDPVPVRQVLVGGEHRHHELVGEWNAVAEQISDRRAPGRLSAPHTRPGRTRAGRPTPAGRAAGGGPPGAGAAPRPTPGPPGRWGCSRGAPAPATAAGRRGRSARGGSRGPTGRAPRRGSARPRARAATRVRVVPGEGPALLVGGGSRATLRTLAR